MVGVTALFDAISDAVDIEQANTAIIIIWPLCSYLHQNAVSVYKRHLPYKAKPFIGINARKIQDCQNREKFGLTKTQFHQVIVA